MSKLLNLRPRKERSFTWNRDNPAESARALLLYCQGLNDDAIAWYDREKVWKRLWARSIRLAVLVLTAVAALLPTVCELFPAVAAKFARSGQTSLVPAGWSTLLLGMAGFLLLLDRFYGFTTGWVRYIRTAMHLTELRHDLDLRWPEHSRTVAEDASGSTCLAAARVFVEQMDACVRRETEEWIAEFQSALRAMEDATRGQGGRMDSSGANLSGSIRLNIGNAADFPDGWTVSLGGKALPSTRENPRLIGGLSSGPVDILVEATRGATRARAAQTVTVKAGETSDVTVSLV